MLLQVNLTSISSSSVPLSESKKKSHHPFIYHNRSPPPPTSPLPPPTPLPTLYHAHRIPRARSVVLQSAVCTRKRRGDGKHVCAMRTGIGVSLFREGSDVLFHPRRRQSCRTAKTCHTIVSKFAHSLITVLSLCLFLSLSLSLSLSFPFPSFLPFFLFTFVSHLPLSLSLVMYPLNDCWSVFMYPPLMHLHIVSLPFFHPTIIFICHFILAYAPIFPPPFHPLSIFILHIYQKCIQSNM